MIKFLKKLTPALPFVNFGGGREKADKNLSELDSKWKAHLAQGGGRNNMTY